MRANLSIIVFFACAPAFGQGLHLTRVVDQVELRAVVPQMVPILVAPGATTTRFAPMEVVLNGVRHFPIFSAADRLAAYHAEHPQDEKMMLVDRGIVCHLASTTPAMPLIIDAASAAPLVTDAYTFCDAFADDAKRFSDWVEQQRHEHGNDLPGIVRLEKSKGDR